MDATRAVVREFNLSDALRAASGATLGALLLVVSSSAARAQGTPADYERANALQAKYEGAAIDIAGPATWIGKSDKLWYRKLSRGSTQYFIYDAQSQHKQIAFDNEKIAASLSKITGNTYDPRKLPFNFIAFEENAEAFAVTVDGTRVRCTTADSACKRIETSGGFGGRGAQSGREGQTRVSPDGNWEAIINNFNVALRPAHGRDSRMPAALMIGHHFWIFGLVERRKPGRGLLRARGDIEPEFGEPHTHFRIGQRFYQRIVEFCDDGARRPLRYAARPKRPFCPRPASLIMRASSEPRASHDREVLTVQRAGIESAGLAFQPDPHRLREVGRDLQVRRQEIGRASGQDGQDSVRPGHRIDAPLDGPVAAPDEYHLSALRQGTARVFRCLPAFRHLVPERVGDAFPRQYLPELTQPATETLTSVSHHRDHGHAIAS